MALSWWGKGYWQICMNHWAVHAKVEFPRFPPDVRTKGVIQSTTTDTQLRNGFQNVSNLERIDPHAIHILPLWSLEQKWWCGLMWMPYKPLGGGFHSTTFDPELRNESFALMSFMGFPAILSTLQPFQICILIEKIANQHFQMAHSWWGKGLWQIWMHHWTVHAKVELPGFPTDVRTGGVIHSTTFDPELRNEVLHWHLLWRFLQY